MRGSESLQHIYIYALQFTRSFSFVVLLLLVLAVCRLWVEFLLSFGYSAATVEIQLGVFYTNGRRSFCAGEQNGGLMWAQPVRLGFGFLNSRTSSLPLFIKALSHCLNRSYAPSILF